MVDVVRAGCIRCGSVQVEWQERPHWRDRRIRWVRLLECHTLVGKSADAAVAAEIVIEGTVFLDEDDDVFDVAQLCARRWTGATSRKAPSATAVCKQRGS